MDRLRKKHRHLAHTVDCGRSDPLPQRASSRLGVLTRRSFLAGTGAVAAAGMMRGITLAQTSVPPSKILFRQIRLFDGKSDAFRSGAQILIQGNRIASIDTTNSAPPSDATVIDCGDRVLMPGLIDCHWHAFLVRP